jgi:serine/threonine-protein kinase RsbW
MDMIRLSVPGTLLFRDVVLRVTASTCKLMRSSALVTEDAKQELSRENHEFDDKVVSAVGEAFNNVAIHAYRGGTAGTVDLEFEIRPDRITIRLLDTGVAFEPSEELTPDFATLPESRMGLYIVRSFMDEVTYRRGNPPTAPNVLTLSKRYIATG